MRFQNRFLVGMTSAFALGAAATSIGPATITLADNDRDYNDQRPVQADRVHLQLTPSSTQLAQCMPNADVNVDVQLTTDKLGFDVSTSRRVTSLPTGITPCACSRKPGHRSGAAEYIGDLNTNDDGNGHAEFHLIVQEAFSSTIVSAWT